MHIEVLRKEVRVRLQSSRLCKHYGLPSTLCCFFKYSFPRPRWLFWLLLNPRILLRISQPICERRWPTTTSRLAWASGRECLGAAFKEPTCQARHRVKICQQLMALFLHFISVAVQGREFPALKTLTGLILNRSHPSSKITCLDLHDPSDLPKSPDVPRSFAWTLSGIEKLCIRRPWSWTQGDWNRRGADFSAGQTFFRLLFSKDKVLSSARTGERIIQAYSNPHRDRFPRPFNYFN